jgi:hypothetical protein
MKTIIALLVLVSVSLSQEPYRIPFASKGNSIELTIANTSAVAASEISVEATSVPSWIVLSQRTVTFDQLGGNEEHPATFTFSVDKKATVNKEETISFTIKSQSGETWSKEIKVKVSPPEKFELFRNYPNPFNPTTTISYQLSADSRVILKVFNVIGQEVATLVDGQRGAGYHQEVFDASRCASGMYVYRIVYTDASGKQSSDRKTMMLVK